MAEEPVIPRLYDISADQWRPVTQRDLDRLVCVEQAYGKLRAMVASVHNELTDALTKQG